MANLIGYKNQLWKVIHDFKCTETDQPFTLNPGKYLFICKGGASNGTSMRADYLEFGGLSMGVLNLSATTTFHAVVGGDGFSSNTPRVKPGRGGFNGGAPGGRPVTSDYSYGIGGGGATDIRLRPYDPSEYPTYDDDGTYHEPSEPPIMLTDSSNNAYYQLEYLRTSGQYNRAYALQYTYFNTGYSPKKNTKIVWDGVIFSKPNTNNDVVLFGVNEQDCNFQFFIKKDGINQFGYNRFNQIGVNDSTPLYDQRITITCYKDKSEWSFGNATIGMITLNDCVETDTTNTLNLFSSSNPGASCQMFSCKIYEVDASGQSTLVKEFLPAERVSDHTYGLFETVSKTFLIETNTNTSGVCPSPRKRTSPSINSRIIVAGGAAGSSLKTLFTGSLCGGSFIAPPIYDVNNVSSGMNNDPNFFIMSNQSSGYTRGYAQPIQNNPSWESSSRNGASGSGGGWFGGHGIISMNNNSTEVPTAGAGGSGYVYTSTSYKPDGYNPSIIYQMTQPFMCGGQSTKGEIIIAKHTNGFAKGDTITFYSNAEMTSLKLAKGSYRLTCYGGCGGFATSPSTHLARGGFAQGTLTLNHAEAVHVNVGGSGYRWNFCGPFGTNTHETAMQLWPTNGYNGGNGPYRNTDTPSILTSGGGTDMRIGGDTMYHRFIVAGGAGANGTTWSGDVVVGGAGGGTTGSGRSSSINPGPGTQTESASSSSYPYLCGSFGQGGPSERYNTGYFGGAGGGGWFGGSGPYVYNSWGSIDGGCGGSGYVYTSTSYKPDGYAVDEAYQLLDTTLTLGGNTSNTRQAYATIEVLELRIPTLARDEEGYKYYDESQKLWILMDTQPVNITKSVFDQYPNSFFETDNGLLNEYTLYVYDEIDQFNNIDLMVTPPPQIITNILETDSNINQIDYNYDGDPASFKFKTLTSERIDDTHIQIKTCIEKTKPTDEILSLYTATITSSGKTHGPHRYINPDGKRDYYRYDKESGEIVHERRKFAYRDPDDYKDEYGRVMTAQWLLQLGIGNRIPIKYRNDVIDANVNLIGSTMFAEYQRMLYCAMIVRYTDSSNAYLVIKGLNLITGELTQVYKHQWNSIFSSSNGGSLGGFLVDEEYFYVTNGYLYDYSAFIYKINKNTFDISKTPNASTTISPRSGMQWYQGSILFATYRNIELYHPSSNTMEIFANHSSSNYNIYDICVGEKYMITTRGDSYIYIIDLNTRNVISRNIGLGGILRVCYDDKTHTFYIASNAYIHPFDEETLELGAGITISPITTPTKAFYINDAVIVTNENSNRLVIYRIDQKNYLSIFLPWTVPSYDNYTSGMFIPYMINGYFFYLYQTLAMLQYEGYAKYNMGYKYNKYILEYNIQHASDITCSDDTFFDIRDTCVTITNGTISYNLSTHVNHIASTTIQKSDYGFLLSTGMS